MTNINAIAIKLNVLESAIVRIEEWASVMFVVVKGIGARFVSKKVVVKMTATKLDKANHIANVFAAEGYKTKVWTGGDKVRTYVGATGIYIEITNNGRQLVGKNTANEYNILRTIDLDNVAANTQSAAPYSNRSGRCLNCDITAHILMGRGYCTDCHGECD